MASQIRPRFQGKTVCTVASKIFPNFSKIVHNLAEVGKTYADCLYPPSSQMQNAGDKAWRRCNWPKWIRGSLDGKFLRLSTRTHSWELAEDSAVN